MKTHLILEESDISGRTEEGVTLYTSAAKDAMWVAAIVTYRGQILKDRHGSLASSELPNECKTTNFVTTDTILPASETRMVPDETPCLQLFVEHSNFMWQIWKGDELGHAVIITRSCGKSIGTKHPLRSGQIPTDIEDRLLAANASQFGILNVTEFFESKAEMSLRD